MHGVIRKMIVGVLVAASMSGLTACGSDKSDKLQGEITISVYESESWLEIAAAMFMQEHPDTKISIHNFYNGTELDMYSGSSMGNAATRPTGQTREDYIAQLNTRIMSGEAEDIIITSIGIPVERYIRMGVFEDLSPYLEKADDIKEENYYMNIFEACRAEDGGLYQFPLSAMAIPLMVFDGELVENTGVRPPEGTSKITWREALDLAKETYDKSTLSNTYMTDANSIAGNMFTKAAMDAMNYGTGTVEFDRERMLSLLRIYVELADYEQPGGNSNPDSHIPFSLAYRPDWEWARDIIIYGEDAKVCQWEYDDGSVYLCPYYALDFGINSDSRNKELAWEFLKFLVSDEIQTLPALPWSGVNKKGLRARIEGLLSGDLNEYTAEQKQAVFEMVESWVLQINAYRQEDSELITLTEGVLVEFREGNRSAYETLDDLQNKLEQFMSE